MTQLSRRPPPLALSIEIRPSGPSATLLDDVQRTQRRMTHRPSRMPLRLAMLFDPIAVERAELGHRLHALTQEITAGQIRIRLHGPPPRSLLRSVLHDALGHDLGTEVRFAPGPPTPLTARAQPLQALLSILALGTDATDDDDARDPRPHRRHIDPDAIPF